MKKVKEFRFENARRFSPEETEKFLNAIAEKLDKPRKSRGRPPKDESSKFSPISIRLHPSALAWAKREAKSVELAIKRLLMRFSLKKLRLEQISSDGVAQPERNPAT